MSPWSAARRAVRYMGIIQCHCGSLGSARPSIRHKRPSTRAKRIGLSQETFLGSIPSECRCDENANSGSGALAELSASVLDRLCDRANPLANLREPEFLFIHCVCDEVMGLERIHI